MSLYNVGEQIFLFAKFENDINNMSFINEPTVQIFFIKNGKTIEILNVKMQTINFIEYYYNFTLPLNLDFGQYQIIYNGFVNGKEHKIYETFYVINNSYNDNPIRIFGYIYDSKNHKELTDVEIQIINEFDNTNYYIVNNFIGQWECYLHSGDYKFIFKRKGYKTQEVIAKINDVLQNIEFSNVIMEEVTNDILGNGIYEITNQYITKDGQPIEKLNINIYNVNDLNNLLIDTKTDSNGKWVAYLDEGLYLLKVFGIMSGKEYNKIFRLKVRNNGEFYFENISKNISSENSIFYPNGKGLYKFIDYIYDKNNKPICDVQVNILHNNQIQYQSYTDLTGKFEFNLDIGKYKVEFYHPSFKTIIKDIEINGDSIGQKIKEV